MSSRKLFFLILIFVGATSFVFGPNKSNTGILSKFETAPGLGLKARALSVLKNKCNSCHLKKNRSVVFNEKNMETKANEIRTQVFIKKRMPKGKFKLTTQERIDLRLWLDSLR